jgi:hypothetical protein
MIGIIARAKRYEEWQDSWKITTIAEIPCGPATPQRQGRPVQDFRVMFDRLREHVSKLVPIDEDELPEDYPAIVQRVPQRHIASYLGITPEALSPIRGRRAKKPSA